MNYMAKKTNSRIKPGPKPIPNKMTVICAVSGPRDMAERVYERRRTTGQSASAQFVAAMLAWEAQQEKGTD